MINPENIGLPEVGGYQWVSPETYESDWLAFLLASNSKLLGGNEEEGAFEFPVVYSHPPAILALSSPSAPDEAVPEPVSVLSMLIGGMFIAFRRRRG